MRALGLAVALAISACRWVRPGAPQPLRPNPPRSVERVSRCAALCTDSVDVVAMGVDGFLIVPFRDTTALVLTPPLFTNPSVWWLTFGDLLFGTRPDTSRITRRLQSMHAANEARLKNVRAVVVGHGHYDHLLDLPPLVPRMPQAVVYGSNTVRNLLAAVPLLEDARRVAVDSLAHTGTSIPVGPAVRLRALPWAHAPNFASFTIAPGVQSTARRTLPRTVHGWKQGPTLAWVVDIVGPDEQVGWRFVYHDAAASGAYQRAAARLMGTMPPSAHTTVIMTAANFDQPGDYPDVLLASLAPDHVMLGHWDDFFSSPEHPERVVRGIVARDLAAKLHMFVGPRWSAPRAGATVRYVW